MVEVFGHQTRSSAETWSLREWEQIRWAQGSSGFLPRGTFRTARREVGKSGLAESRKKRITFIQIRCFSPQFSHSPIMLQSISFVKNVPNPLACGFVPVTVSLPLLGDLRWCHLQVSVNADFITCFLEIQTTYPKMTFGIKKIFSLSTESLTTLQNRTVLFIVKPSWTF